MEADKTTHQFKPNSRFEDAVALYNFDIELRDLMFKRCSTIRDSFAYKIIQEFSLAHGPFWFFDTSLADDEHKFIENMNSIDRFIIGKIQISLSDVRTYMSHNLGGYQHGIL